MLFVSCFRCCATGGPPAPVAAPATTAGAVSSQHRDADVLNHRDLVGLLWNGSTDQKAWAAQRVTLDAGGSDPEASAAHRQALLLLDVLQPLQAMLRSTGSRLRTAAANALCNLALEAAAGTTDALAACSPNPSPPPPWRLLYDALPTLVPGLCHLIGPPPSHSAPDAAAALPAARALSNLMRGAAFVPRTLPLLSPLPTLAQQLVPTPNAELKQQFSQMLLNAALHSGTASALDAAQAPQALMLLLHQDAPAGAHERCLCTLYNMLRGEEGSARRAADIISLPIAKQALCTQLYKDQPNCRFLSACLIMCMLRSASENTNEWASSGSDRYDDQGAGGGRTPRRRAPRRSEAYRRVVAELGSGGAGGGVVWSALQHALDSALTNARVRREFAYGRREQLMQALVAALHALCTMDEPPTTTTAAAAARPEAEPAPARQGSRRQAVNSSTSSGLSQGYQGSAAAAASTRAPLLDQLSSAAASALLQLLPVNSGAAAADPALTWACLSLLSLMSTSAAARRVLLGLKHPGALEGLAAVVTSTRALTLRSAVGESVAAAVRGPTPAATAPGSSAVTPRVASAGAHRTAAAARAAAAMRDVAAAYLSPSLASGGSAAAGGDDGTAWGRCQALAAKTLRNLAVAEPAALLQHRAAVPTLLLALYGPAPTTALALTAGHTFPQLQPAPAPAPAPQPLQPLLPATESPTAPLPSLSPRPGPTTSPRPSFTTASPSTVGWPSGLGPEWSREVQRHAAAALISLLVTAKAFSDAACAAVVEAGGIPVIAEVMNMAASAPEHAADPSSEQQQQQQQLSAWCATLLAKLYVSSTPCQHALTEALVSPTLRRAGVLALLHLVQPDLRATGAATGASGLGAQYGPMYKSLHRRAAPSVSTSQLTLQSAHSSEAPPAPGWAEEAAAAAVEEVGAGAVVRLSPVMEQEKAKAPGASQGALATALGPEGDVLKSTAASTTRRVDGEADASDVLRTSTQALKDLMSSSSGPGPGQGAAAARRSQQLGGNASEELRASAEVQGLAAMMRSMTAGAEALAGRPSAGQQQQGGAGDAGLVQHAEGSSSSGGFSSMASVVAGGVTGAERAAAREEAMRQLAQRVRQCQPSYLDDPPVTATAGVACDDDGTGVTLAALEHG